MAESLPRIVVMVSGGGTNLQALIDAVESGALPAQIALVVSNRRDAYALQRAEQHGIPSLYFPLKPYTNAGRPRSDYDADLATQIVKSEPDLIVLAGWMHVLSPAFLERFPRQIINLHPALPGEFPGADAIDRAFAAFRAREINVSGCMVHYVIPEVDAGEVIASAAVPFLKGDTLDSYSERLHAAEHQLLVYATLLALSKR
jgi:formyltetrahydrofolate-dependent phosphoribosylglycinamide formyltransferase